MLGVAPRCEAKFAPACCSDRRLIPRRQAPPDRIRQECDGPAYDAMLRASPRPRGIVGDVFITSVVLVVTLCAASTKVAATATSPAAGDAVRLDIPASWPSHPPPLHIGSPASLHALTRLGNHLFVDPATLPRRASASRQSLISLGGRAAAPLPLRAIDARNDWRAIYDAIRSAQSTHSHPSVSYARQEQYHTSEALVRVMIVILAEVQQIRQQPRLAATPSTNVRLLLARLRRIDMPTPSCSCRPAHAPPRRHQPRRVAASSSSSTPHRRHRRATRSSTT